MTDEQNILIRVIAREQMPIGTRADPPRSAVSPLPSGLFLLLMFPAVVSAALASDPRAILFDFGFSERTERRITNVLWVVGIATIVYGVVLFAAILNAA